MKKIDQNNIFIAVSLKNLLNMLFLINILRGLNGR